MKRTLSEHIQRIKYLNGYGKINEATYSLVDGIDEDDEMPFKTPQPNAPADLEGGEDITNNEPSNLGAGEDVPTPENGDSLDDTPEGDEGIGEPEVNVDVPMDAAEEESTPDEIQNEIIRSNIEVMKQLSQKIDSLESMAKQLTVQNFKMAKEVEEVREPTNVEKLVNKKQDSHPYYMGLNDLWKGNWFQARRDETDERGMKQTEDGQYIADFDDLPHASSNEIKKSFEEF